MIVLRAEAILTDLEDKTGLIKRFHAMHKQLQQIAEDAEKILERNGSCGATQTSRRRPGRSGSWPRCFKRG